MRYIPMPIYYGSGEMSPESVGIMGGVLIVLHFLIIVMFVVRYFIWRSKYVKQISSIRYSAALYDSLDYNVPDNIFATIFTWIIIIIDGFILLFIAGEWVYKLF